MKKFLIWIPAIIVWIIFAIAVIALFIVAVNHEVWDTQYSVFWSAMTFFATTAGVLVFWGQLKALNEQLESQREEQKRVALANILDDFATSESREKLHFIYSKKNPKNSSYLI